MASSCGGKGPYDAATWAKRTGHGAVADAILNAAHLRATVTEHNSRVLAFWAKFSK